MSVSFVFASVMSSLKFCLPLAAFSLIVPGCLDQFEDEGALVHVYSTHHATPENGLFPRRGEDNMPRVFLHESGWEITLTESYITISDVVLVGCDGVERPFNMFWGPCPEDLRTEDLATLTVAGLQADPGQYCGLRVTYGPYTEPVVDDDTVTQHRPPANLAAIDGQTLYLRGGVRQDAQSDPIPFELRNDSVVTVELDISELEGPGQPMNVRRQEDFPKELTITKTYDRFFDGVEFDTMDEDLVEQQLDEILREQTRVALGQVISPELY